MKETTVIALTKTQLPSWIADFNTNETLKKQHIIITLPEEEHWLRKTSNHSSPLPNSTISNITNQWWWCNVP